MAPSQLLCVRCARMRPAAPMCPLHPDEPLLDPADERVVFELMAIDDRARSRSHARWAGLLGGIGLAGAAGVLVLLDAIGAPAMEFFWEAVIGLTLGGAILGGVISIRRFRPRFAQWTKDPGAEPGGY